MSGLCLCEHKSVCWTMGFSVRVYTFVNIKEYISVCVCVHVCRCMFSLCVSEHTRVHVYKHVCICVYACSPLICLYMCKCVYFNM